MKELVGLLIGMNVEFVDENLDLVLMRVLIELGRKVLVVIFKKVNELGLDFILLIGNLGIGVINDLIVKNVVLVKKYFDGIIIVGKMYSLGVDELVVSLKLVE